MESIFQYFWKKFNTQKHLKLPSRTTIADEALNDSYICVKNALVRFLSTNTPDHAFVTFDSWTDSHRRLSYITYTYHFIDDKWNIFSTVLNTTYFESPHTAERTEQSFKDMIEKFNLIDKRLFLITDNAAVMKAACQRLNRKRTGCSAHSVNRLIQYDLLEKVKDNPHIETIRNLINKMRKCQRALLFKCNELKQIHEKDRNDLIFSILEELNEDMLASEQIMEINDLKESNCAGSFNATKAFSTIRWGCVYKMCKFYCDYQSTIKKCLDNNFMYEHVMKPDELRILEGLVQLLEIFHVFTTHIQGSSYTTLNLLPLFYSEIEQHLETIINSDDRPEITTAARILYSNLNKRIELTLESIVASILDPAKQHLDVVDTWLVNKGIY